MKMFTHLQIKIADKEHQHSELCKCANKQDDSDEKTSI